MSLENDFNKAVEDVQKLPSKPSNDDLLILYSLFKQATIGPARDKRPSALNIIARKKFDQWKALGSMEKNLAMKEYVAKVKELEQSC